MGGQQERVLVKLVKKGWWVGFCSLPLFRHKKPGLSRVFSEAALMQ
jgi:hypothetical protein